MEEWQIFFPFCSYNLFYLKIFYCQEEERCGRMVRRDVIGGHFGNTGQGRCGNPKTAQPEDRIDALTRSPCCSAE